MGIAATDNEQLDVLIVGAGLSGVGAAAQLSVRSPQKTYAVLEMRGGVGGTWDLFRFPGVRSDSDMFTFGYSFKPWNEGKVLADGPSIRNYVGETAREYGVEQKIRFHHRVHSLSWSTEDARWTARGERTDTGEAFEVSAGFVVNGTGYYSYDEAYTPEFPGADRFKGEIIHPQFWPEDLDYAGKRVIVIGSGATAVTVVPAMADTAEHVTMLQRSPSYVLSLPEIDPVARGFGWFLPDRLVHRLARGKNVVTMLGIFGLSRRWPKLMRRILMRSVRKQLPPGYEVDKHFNPAYDPWDQRLCFVPEGDLFEAISAGDASVVTDRIKEFTEDGILLESGDRLEADLIVTATGLKITPLGGMTLSVDGTEVDVADTVLYRMMMMTGIPNLAWVIGYTNISWTLRCNLTAQYVCRLLNHMDEHGYDYCVPKLDDEQIERAPAIDLQAGYVQRGIDAFPKQGPVPPWLGSQNFVRDLRYIGRAELEDGALRFVRSPRSSPRREPEPVA